MNNFVYLLKRGIREIILTYLNFASYWKELRTFQPLDWFDWFLKYMPTPISLFFYITAPSYYAIKNRYGYSLPSEAPAKYLIAQTLYVICVGIFLTPLCAVLTIFLYSYLIKKLFIKWWWMK